MQQSRRRSRICGRASRRVAAVGLALAMLTGIQAVPAGGADADAEGQHLLISEVVTGGASASDEFIEIFNPGPAALPLEGLEVVYLSATGTTPSARAAWPAGAASVPPGGHVLIANAGGLFAAIADGLYGSAIAATGGSVALRIQGASTSIDAVGWGTAANAWMEGRAAPAPTAGASLERLPGGELGSTQDTGDNLVDFAERTPPDPQNTTSPPTPFASPSPVASPSPNIAPTAPDEATPTASPHETASPSEFPVASVPPSTSPTQSVTATPSETGSPSAAPTPSPAPSPLPITEARALPDGSVATVAGVALTSSDFADGGGYVADAGGGIAVLVTDAAFARGDAVVATGEVDDRFSQRTLRVEGADLTVSGTGVEPAALSVATGVVGEALEGRLVSLTGSVDGAPTRLTGGLAFDLDDGSGAVRVLVSDATGIDVDGWTDGAIVSTVGVVGQRDSGGTGTTGYRVQPRAPSDVRSVVAPTASPSGDPDASASGAPTSPDASADVPLLSIADARAAGQNLRLRVRGVVTLPSGLVDGSAVVQDATGAILLRLGDEAGGVERGHQIEVSGTRSTKGGMLTLRVSEPPIRLGRAAEPALAARATGAVGEADEALLVAVRGGIVATPRRSSTGTVSFEIDDGSGPLRIHLAAAAGIEDGSLAAGAWVAVSGVVGQETTGSAPTSGYRLWPRDGGDLRVLAAPVAGAARLDGTTAKGTSRTGRATVTGASGPPAPRGLERVLSAADGGPAVTVEATLVAGPWPQLGLAGVLWDGARVAGIVDEPAARAALAAATASGMPVALRLDAQPPPGSLPDLSLPTVRLAGSVEPTGALPERPATAPPSSGPPIWVRISGLVSRDEAGAVVAAADGLHRLEVLCDPSPLPDAGSALVHGIGVADPPRLVVGCDGVRLAATLTDGSGPSAARVPLRATAEGSATVEVAPRPDLIPGALLVAAIAALGGFGFVLIRRGVRPFAPGTGATPTDPAASGSGGDTVEDATGPSLTLLPLPRERGSP